MANLICDYVNVWWEDASDPSNPGYLVEYDYHPIGNKKQVAPVPHWYHYQGKDERKIRTMVLDTARYEGIKVSRGFKLDLTAK